MITIKAEREYYCLATDGEAWTVIERRAGRYYSLGNCTGPGVALDEPGAASLFSGKRRYSEAAAHHLLEDVGMEWRDLLEHIR